MHTLYSWPTRARLLLPARASQSNRSTCKKCSQKIDKDILRLGKAFDNGERLMTQWFHVGCWPVPKALTCLGEIEGWAGLTSAQRASIIARAPNRAPPADGGAPGAATPASPFAASKAAGKAVAPAPAAAAGLDDAADVAAGGGTTDLAAFAKLCASLEGASGSLDKTAIISKHIKRIASEEDRYLTIRLLLPSKKEHDLRVYNLKDKSLIAHLAQVLRTSENAMKQHFDQSSDFGLTAEHCTRHIQASPASKPAWHPSQPGIQPDSSVPRVDLCRVPIPATLAAPAHACRACSPPAIHSLQCEACQEPRATRTQSGPQPRRNQRLARQVGAAVGALHQAPRRDRDEM